MEEAAFVPQEKITKADVQETSVPPYEDKGVRYQGYSKTLKGGNYYTLNYQTPFSYTNKLASFSGTQFNSIGTPPKFQRLFIKSIQLNTSISAVDVNSYFRIVSSSGANVTTLFETALLRSETTNFYFEPALIVNNEFNQNITPSGCGYVISSGAATLNCSAINIQGWTE